jgi:hypothetical protein
MASNTSHARHSDIGATSDRYTIILIVYSSV